MIGLIIYILATFGASALITNYDGFNDIFLKLRKKLPTSPFSCTVCLSVFFAFIFFVPIWLGFGLYLTPFAVIGAVILLERI